MEKSSTLVSKTKACTDCKRELPNTTAFFHRRKARSGLYVTLSWCKNCHNRSSAKIARRIRNQRRAEGLCIKCGNQPPAGNRQTCLNCHTLQKRQAETKRAEKKKHGTCSICKKPAATKRRFCLDHLAKAKRDVRERYHRLVRQGFCRRCFVRPSLQGQRQCLNCRDKHRNVYQAEKQRVFEAYGLKCECCGEANPCFLTIDHINNDGAAERQAGVRNIYRKIIRDGFPDTYRLLCFNCNCARYHQGICPHQIVP
jgi:hypothetical protein